MLLCRSLLACWQARRCHQLGRNHQRKGMYCFFYSRRYCSVCAQVGCSEHLENMHHTDREAYVSVYKHGKLIAGSYVCHASGIRSRGSNTAAGSHPSPKGTACYCCHILYHYCGVSKPSSSMSTQHCRDV